LNAKDLHRPLSDTDNLDEILAWREQRTVTRNLVLHYDRMMLILEPTPLTRALARKTVEVVNYPDGRFAIRHMGSNLPFRVFDKIRTVEPGTIVENKRLTEVLAYVQARQATYAPNRRRYHPARQRPPNNLEAPGSVGSLRLPCLARYRQEACQFLLDTSIGSQLFRSIRHPTLLHPYLLLTRPADGCHDASHRSW
jgi:hypothetical protein